MLNVYGDPSLYDPEHRYHLNNILKAHWNDKSQELRLETYGYLAEGFTVVDAPEQADLILFTYKWNHYVRQSRIADAIAFAERMRPYEKPIVLWSVGDYRAELPEALHDVYLFQASGYQSLRLIHEFASYPPMNDTLVDEGDGAIEVRPKQPQPVVGFCGQAVTRPNKAFMLALRNLSMHRPGNMPYFKPPPILPAQYLRGRILHRLQQSPSVKTNFIINDKYWGGVDEAEKSTSTARETFLNNLTHSDYNVCVRGNGNWSKRLYETLNWGRIPIFVDTDCVLPYDFDVDWREYCVWVDESDVPRIGEIVAEFHDRLSPAEFEDLQRACREFWQSRLAARGYWSHFHRHFQ